MRTAFAIALFSLVVFDVTETFPFFYGTAYYLFNTPYRSMSELLLWGALALIAGSYLVHDRGAVRRYLKQIAAFAALVVVSISVYKLGLMGLYALENRSLIGSSGQVSIFGAFWGRLAGLVFVVSLSGPAIVYPVRELMNRRRSGAPPA